MSSLGLLLILTILSDVAGVLAIRGVPFLALKALGFGDAGNLLLMLTYGLAYVPAALVSHRVCARLGERRCLAVMVAVETAVFGGTGLFWDHPASLFACLAVMGFTGGVKWPVLESYVSAGRGGASQAHAIGVFNLAWAGIFPVALFGAGPIIDLTGGAGDFHAHQTMSVPDPHVYKPDLQINQQNEVHGDQVSGAYWAGMVGEIAEYCAGDVAATINVMLGWCGIPQMKVE